jgi:O-methyltransferase
MGAVRNAVKRMLARRGFEQVPRQDLEPEFLELYDRCRPYTMTSVERMYALYISVRHMIEREVAGDVVECGVFAGGSAMLAG